MTNRIFYNGNIHLTDKNNTIVEAIYVEGDTIKFTGTNKQVKEYEAYADGIIDLNKRTVIPGFIESHMHLLYYGKSLNEVDLSGCSSIDEVIEISKRFIIDNKITSNKWLVGFGWHQENFKEKRMLTKYDLDKISTEIPISLSRACIHITSCNSKALSIANIDINTKVEGGQVDVSNGDTTGILRENAMSLIDEHMPEMSRDEKKQLLLRALSKLASYGITSVHTDDLTDENGGLEILKLYKELEQEGKLTARILVQVRIESLDDAKRFFELGFNNIKSSNDFKINSIKLLGDGSLGGQTAAMNQPYENSKDKGIALFEQEELDNIVDLAHVNNVPVVMHAIGDRTIDMAINSFEKAILKHPENNVRHGIVHCQLTSTEALERIKKNHILAYIQPIFVAADSKIAEKTVGAKRTKTSYNWKTLSDFGVVITFGTDSPVESPNPFENIYCAVNRMDLHGIPEGGWMKEQKLTVEESVRAYTVNGAYASYDENIKGSLEVGKLADFIVLSDNIYEVDEDKIKDISCVMTVKGGKIVYDK